MRSTSRRSTSSVRVAVSIAALLALVARDTVAQAPRGPDRVDAVAALEARIADGTFAVLGDSSRAVIVLGTAPPDIATGAPVAVDGGDSRDPFIIAARPLARRHPAILDSLTRRRVRLVGLPRWTPERTFIAPTVCETSIVDVRIARVLSRGQLMAARENEGRAMIPRSREAALVWSAAYRDLVPLVVAVLADPCPDARLATTHTDGAPRVIMPITLTAAEQTRYVDAYDRTDERRSMDASRAELGRGPDEADPQVSAFMVGAARRLIFVSDTFYSSNCDSSPQRASVLFEEWRTARATSSGNVHPDALYDLDGDGAFEIVDVVGEWRLNVLRIRASEVDVRHVTSVYVNDHDGC